ncbi:MAG: NAD-glutamate dehydrogenase [Caulobacteraceae bacterium]|nr:NAD-glutamate dehydrogenase [Caulobacteraceae bacterium]
MDAPVALAPQTAPASTTEDALAEAFAAALKRPGGRVQLSQSEAAFVSQMFADYLPGELAGVSVADVAANLANFWAWAAKRPDPSPQIRRARALAASRGTLAFDRLEILQADSPFLVDSVMAEIAEAGLAVRAMYHAVVETTRSPGGTRGVRGRQTLESMIQIFLDPLPDDRAETLIAGVRATLDDVRAAVGDYPAMRALLDRAAESLATEAAHVEPDALQEYGVFLRWLRDDHFVLLGARSYDYPRTADGGYAAEEALIEPERSLGVLRDPKRSVLRRDCEPAVLSAALRESLARAEPVVVAKSNLRSRVHRRVFMDYVGVRRFGPDGKASGETRFVGLFTAEAYDTPADQAPLVRRKLARVLARAGKPAGGHSDRQLRNILENYPRDELFQIEEDALLAIALGVAHLYDRPRLRLFARRDPFDRFVSILLFLPRDAYGADLAATAGQILAEAFDGQVTAFFPAFSDAPLARIHYEIGFTPSAHGEPDLALLEARIAEATRSWGERLAEAMHAEIGLAGKAGELLRRYGEAFPPGYRDLYDAAEALRDIAAVESLKADEPVRIRAFRDDGDPPALFRFKLYRAKSAVALADVLPILDNMDLKALAEEGFALHHLTAAGAGAVVWVHEFVLVDGSGEAVALEQMREAFETAFIAVWTGQTESDGFNRLVIALGLTWREAALVRSLARYRQQTGLDPTPAVQAQALADNPVATRLILDLFRVRFDPDLAGDLRARKAQADALGARIVQALVAVESLDADRVLRRITALVGAITRTNYYQPDEAGAAKPYISFKIDSQKLADLPAPKPFREIFVWATHVEGVHLRFGPVARGGLRWSDRRDDFRTEVLGLVKAQQVKNAVIVPVGSKGGFYPKQLPRGGTAEAVRAEAVRAYRTFLCGLLDLTDNLSPVGEIEPPKRVIRHDGDDPYLVVAADKGTATFSDIANRVAEDYGFWLGDAFASGGSAGYDHKAMGITARGAWEAVKRHFRELGKDIQTEPFTVAGVGDMSGDVFGNGMLLSKAIKLVAAFDHRDIFIDPAPDPAVAFAERKRLFDLPRSSWADYDKALISPGGGVFSRSLKSITPTPEMKALLDLRSSSLTPAELIQAILKARVELLYFGGIGAYVKAPTENHLDVGDKANDLVRVDAGQLRCRVVGEGANLGVTQAGRIAYARAGGRIDTDAIDNSAGVDTSDHEVNIKILTGVAERSGGLTRKARDVLLQSMTDDVAAHVLAHNYDQTLALSLMESTAAAELEAHARFMAELEAKGRLDRAVEGLPDAAQIETLAAAGKGLTRPELSVLLAYGKIDLVEQVVAGHAPDDPAFLAVLEGYFPAAMEPFRELMKRHRLRREIIATVVSNDIVNTCGPTFPGRLRAAAACDADALVIGYQAAKRILRFSQIWRAVTALDGAAPAEAQMAMFAELSTVLAAQTYWMARRAASRSVAGGAMSGAPVGAGKLVATYAAPTEALRAAGPTILSPLEQKAIAQTAKGFIRAGAPADLARKAAALRALTGAADLIDMAADSAWPVEAVARLHHKAGARFGFDRMRAAAAALQGADAYERLALRRLTEDMLLEQTALTRAIMRFAGGAQAAENPEATLAGWCVLHADPVKLITETLADVEQSAGGWSFAKLTIANAALREIASQAG